MVKCQTERITNKGMVVIPIEIRRQLHIEEGDKLEISVDDGVATFRVVKKKSVLDAFGMLKTDKPYQPISQIRETVMADMVREKMDTEHE